MKPTINRAEAKYRTKLPQLERALARTGVPGSWVYLSEIALFRCEGGCGINYINSTGEVLFSGPKSERDRLEALIAPSLELYESPPAPSPKIKATNGGEMFWRAMMVRRDNPEPTDPAIDPLNPPKQPLRVRCVFCGSYTMELQCVSPLGHFGGL